MANYSFQSELISQTILNLDKQGIGLVAAGTGSGKTDIAIAVIQDYLKKNPRKRVLFLAHATTTLRSQVAERFKAIKAFSSEEIHGKSDLSAQVHVAIPQNKTIRDVSYGLIVTDESHQYEDAKMVQALVESNKSCKRLLLTASHGKFTARKTPAVYFSLLEGLEAGVISEPSVTLITTKQDFRNFDTDGNLSSKEKLQEIDSLVKKFKPLTRGKTLVACHNQAAARAVQRLLGKTAVLSTADDDGNNIKFNKFQSDPTLKYLVVVFKGVIGFSMNELETVIDLTASQNVDRITQLMGRVVRLHPGKKPLYVKLAPKLQHEWYQHVMSAVMTLAHPEAFRAWNGRIDSVKVPVTRTATASNAVVKGSRGLPTFKPKIPTWNELNNLFAGGAEFVSLSRIRSLTIGGGQDSVGKKEVLLELARSGAPRPKIGTVLGSSMCNYIRPSSGAYDEAFTKEIVNLRPDWKSSQRPFEESFAELKEFYEKHKRLPKPIDGRAGRFLSKAVSRGPTFKQKVRDWVDSVGIERRPGIAGRKRVLCVETGEVFKSAKDAARALGLTSKSSISSVCTGRNKTAGGYTFRYVD